MLIATDVTVRPVRPEDAAALLTYFKALVRADPERVERLEDADNLTLEMERRWIERNLDAEAKGEFVLRCAEVNGVVVALGEVERKSRWIERHVAEVRFGVLPGFEAAGAALLGDLCEAATRLGVETLIWFHLATQRLGLSIVQRHGFTLSGVLPGYYRRGAESIDRVYYTLTTRAAASA